MNPNTPSWRDRNNIAPWFHKTKLPLLLALCSSGVNAQDLAHRWSFTNLTDSVGGANATLLGTATVSGGQLVLPGGAARTNYAEVPIGPTIAAASSLTVETWFNTTTAQNWAKVWMFGKGGTTDQLSDYIDFTPHSGVGGTPPSASFHAANQPAFDTRGGTNPPNLATGTQNMSTVVYDDPGNEIRLYLNGTLADSAPWSGTVSQLGNTSQNFIGAPVRFNDPGYTGSVSELRVWKGVMGTAQVTANFNAGPDSVPPRDPHIDALSVIRVVSSGDPISFTIPIKNLGTSNTLTVTSAVLGGDAEFRYNVTSALPLSIAPGVTSNLQVSFDPEGEPGTYPATLTLNSNDPFEAAKVIILNGEAALPELNVPTTAAFGPVANTAAVQNYNFQIGNTGGGPLSITGATFIAGPNAPTHFQQFTVGRNFTTQGALTVPANGTANLPITFNPAMVRGGIKSGILRILTDDADEGQVDIRIDVTVTAAAAAESPPVLAHRWSFTGNTNDSVGGATGVLNGTASVSGGNLVLLGGGVRTNHVTVPIGTTIASSSSLTVEAWYTTNTLADYAKLFMFGTAGTSAAQSTYLEHTPYAGIGGNPPIISISSPPTGETNTRAAPNPPTAVVGTLYHVTAVYDSVNDLISLYINGVLADSNAWTGEVSDLGNTVDNFIGAAVFYGDPDWVGTISEFRIWKGAFTASNVTASQTAGVDTLPDVTDGGGGTQGPIGVGTVQVTGGNIVISNVTGLVAGAQYHLETGVALNDFVPVAGSTFTGGSAIPTVPASGPRRFVRIVSGPTP